jgi:cytochrome-b5 reductase
MQIIDKVLSDPSDKTKLSLVFGNLTEKDILLKDYFAKIEKEHPGQGTFI